MRERTPHNCDNHEKQPTSFHYPNHATPPPQLTLEEVKTLSETFPHVCEAYLAGHCPGPLHCQSYHPSQLDIGAMSTYIQKQTRVKSSPPPYMPQETEAAAARHFAHRIPTKLTSTFPETSTVSVRAPDATLHTPAPLRRVNSGERSPREDRYSQHFQGFPNETPPPISPRPRSMSDGARDSSGHPHSPSRGRAKAHKRVASSSTHRSNSSMPFATGPTSSKKKNSDAQDEDDVVELASYECDVAKEEEETDFFSEEESALCPQLYSMGSPPGMEEIGSALGPLRNQYTLFMVDCFKSNNGVCHDLSQKFDQFDVIHAAVCCHKCSLCCWTVLTCGCCNCINLRPNQGGQHKYFSTFVCLLAVGLLSFLACLLVMHGRGTVRPIARRIILDGLVKDVQAQHLLQRWDNDGLLNNTFPVKMIRQYNQTGDATRAINENFQELLDYTLEFSEAARSLNTLKIFFVDPFYLQGLARRMRDKRTGKLLSERRITLLRDKMFSHATVGLWQIAKWLAFGIPTRKYASPGEAPHWPKPLKVINPEDRAYVTLLYGNRKSLLTTACLWLKGVREFDSRTDIVALVAHDVSSDNREYLVECGFKLRDVPEIRLPDRIITQLRLDAKEAYRRQFLKLFIWQMTEYKKVFYMDTDITVIEPIEDLFSCPAQVCAVLEPLPGGGTQLNGGLLVIKPSKSYIFPDMIRNLNTYHGHLLYAEQTYLSWYFVHKRPELFLPLHPSYNYCAPFSGMDKPIKVYHHVLGTLQCPQCQVYADLPFQMEGFHDAQKSVVKHYADIDECGKYAESNEDICVSNGCHWCGWEPFKCVSQEQKGMCKTSIDGIYMHILLVRFFILLAF